jgi:Ser/Thr protein kinase RdoA (MazF antagonist)
MSSSAPNRLREAAEIAARFGVCNGPTRVDPFGNGLINHTFLVSCGKSRMVLQRINSRVFSHPGRILANLSRLSTHLEKKAGTRLRIPGLIPARDGRRWIEGEEGALWRLMEFIDGGRVLAGIRCGGQAAEVGRALGAFHVAAADLDTREMAVTIPNFHVTPGYVDRLIQLAQNRNNPRNHEIQPELDFISARRASTGVLERARLKGDLPDRVVHGDPKLDNFLFDDSERRALAVIDLDTVQPGIVHYDIGDCLRSCCNRGGESMDGHTTVSFDLLLCRGLLAAYAKETGPLLAPPEVELIYDAIRLIPFELGVRFLTDHLEGDRWFRVAYPGQNLAKARIQLALTEDVERKEAAIREIIERCFAP